MDRDRLIKTFCDLVKIPSESPDDKEFIAYLEELFKKEGAKTAKDDFGNLVASFDAKGSSSKETVMFCCHGDTVKPGIGIRPIVEEKVIRSSGDTILGGDDKAGIAEIIEMLRSAKKHPPIEVLITRCEEIAPAGAEFLDYSLIKSKMGYVLDMDTPSDVITGGPTCTFFKIKFKGRPAHAGVSPEKGVSAIQAACEAIANLRLGRIDEETTANVGVIKGGLSMNIIPEDVEMEAECRSLNDKKAKELLTEMKNTLKKAAEKFGAQVHIEETQALEAYSIPKDSKVVQLAVNAMNKNGVKPDIKAIAGGTDATHINHHGIQTAVLGTGARMMHSTEEYVVIDELIDLTKIITTIVEDLA
jgi:tripeptide aminopeptidase